MNTSLESLKRKCSKKIQKGILPILIMALLFTMVRMPDIADAATSVSVAVNYLEETATITAGAGGSTKFFMSTDKGKSWEGIDGNIVDISTLMSTKTVDVQFKGNLDTAALTYTLMAEPTDLTVNISYLTGSGLITFTPPSGTTVEYRKGANGAWKPAYTNMSTALFEVRGNTLYFRTAAMVGRRCSKIVAIKVAKRPSAPSVKLDGSKLVISGVKPGETQYRVNAATAWTTLPASTVKEISIYNLLAAGVVSNVPIPAGTIEFRTGGSVKKTNSAPKLIEITGQTVCPDTIAVTGSTIMINDTTTPKRAYEYTILEGSATLDLSKAKWSSIAIGKSVIIPKVAVGNRVLIRIKSSVEATTKQVLLASTYKEYTISAISPTTK